MLARNIAKVIKTFLGLTDTPSSYTGQGGKTVAVKGTEDGLEFVAGGGGATVFTGLTDTPANYTGSGGKSVAVNAGETALEFVTAFTSYDMGLYTDPVTPSSSTSFDMGAY